ncbi:DUF6915 family protein [Pedobacter chitinilyticus]|uniref:DUF6915 domain-containing protein n=1 Tax=Pedobacter chitinilyticus TaxID=2233776 RepID=A0A3S3R6T8_9SPHI|nr:hypothetical protein [Pedobacter chitinilyticus]RWU08174.1 hypothetical protein DPV69_07270 [Pedobacter chitinilyticus]
MHYYEHALLSAHKFGCAIEDTLQLHKLMDSSKFFFPASQHRLFSHNTWFVHVLTELIGDTIPNSVNGQRLSTRDVLYEHLREDHNGKTPSLQDWLGCLHFELDEQTRTWFNHPRGSDKNLLKEIKSLILNPIDNEQPTPIDATAM